ncbi:branched-chain amino acid ABC transporter permease [Acinetobacter sp. ANC 4558]|uniref:AzlC family ABC transporter permease n=1 Tax=Acinetobacter sp. ANC 4558 TaxID=1977876 RepID=UPI000A32D023|nr:AzlC family ABC transporter permease [Acinetobacter sp. ANC 4558]OTG87592.1 branched-chain amino acid ABC transporter permease [Acinetobacter sp. ANC 4558]
MNDASFKQSYSKWVSFKSGVRDMLPLSLAVIPWAIMAGSLAMTAGLSIGQSIAMSALVFAGAAQIMSLSMLMADASSMSILITIFFMTTQHYIYSLSLRNDLQKYSGLQRVSLGFLLTDELYAISELYPHRSYSYLIGAGFSFYMIWVIFSILGIFFTFLISDLSSIHLDYSIVAIFLVMAVFLIKNMQGIIAVCISVIFAFIFTWFEIQSGLIFASLIGMAVAAILDKEEE